jgi:FkbM family methyltransferase
MDRNNNKKQESAPVSVKRKIVGLINRVPAIDNFVYTARHGPARGLKRQGGLGWLPSFVPRLSEWDAEETFLANQEWRGLTVYDIGGDQGQFTIFFAHRVGADGQVVVFEPNPRSYRRIQRNVQLNDFRNVRVMPIGLGAQRAKLQFAFPTLEPARGTADPAIAKAIRNEASATGCEIEVNSLDDEIVRSGLPLPHFIKVDVEGMEYPVLKGMRSTLMTHRPRLSIEIHGANMSDKIANAGRVVGFLEELGYRMRHIESGAGITSGNVEGACEGHLFCEKA